MRCTSTQRYTRAAIAAAVLATTLCVTDVRAQSLATYEPVSTRQAPFELSIRSIMRGAEHVGQSPQGVTWSDDGEWVYFRWLPGGEEWHAERRLYRVAAAGGTPEEVQDE